jgi:hypothetical protein
MTQTVHMLSILRTEGSAPIREMIPDRITFSRTKKFNIRHRKISGNMKEQADHFIYPPFTGY